MTGAVDISVVDVSALRHSTYPPTALCERVTTICHDTGFVVVTDRSS
jgi:hypothetical protein